jgi:monofunctional biosynthetic peptidoglycan transglycosylase
VTGESPAMPRRSVRRLLAWVAGVGFGIFLLLIVVYRFVAPPITPLMLIRLAQGEGIERDWVLLNAIAPDVLRAVIASEDAKFCTHHGFDWDAVDNAIDRYEEGGHVLGASTISMQTAKNVFLWPGRDFVRKGLEAGLTLLIEPLWGKRRILEIYLNVIEWGHGLYGVEAAARRYFHRPAAALTASQAAALAAILPSPRRWSPTRPGGHVAVRIRTIEARMRQVDVVPGRVCP